MGREWYNGERSICSSKSKRKSNEANGCITALYHFFHFHHFYFPSRHHHHQQPGIDSHSRNSKGTCLPSLLYRRFCWLSFTSINPQTWFGGATKQLGLNRGTSIVINKLQAGKRKLEHPCGGGTKSTLRGLLVDTSFNNCNSPRTKTPNVVARLMGLDLLPDKLNLNKSSRYTVRGHRLSGNGSGTRSLPSSPRISSDSDNRRLSLQLNRENKHEEFARRTLKELKQEEGSPSPRHNGRQIVKQIKERATSRKFGMDITNLLEKRRAGAAQHKIDHSWLSQKENTTRTNRTLVLRQDHICQQPTKVTLSKDFKENLRRASEQSLIPINGCKKAESASILSPHPTTNNQNKQRLGFISISTHLKSSDCCDLLEKKKCKKISVASSAFSVTECPRKQMKRAEEPERNAEVSSKYKKKLPQEPSSSNFYDSTTIFATLANARGTEKNLPGMKKLEEEEERIVAEIERHIVDALVWETVETVSFVV